MLVLTTDTKGISMSECLLEDKKCKPDGKLLVDLLLLLYLLILGILCNFFSFSDFFKSLFAAPTFLVLPILVGRVVTGIYNRKSKYSVDEFTLENFIESWFLGAIFLLFLALFADLLSLFEIEVYIYTVMGVVCCYVLYRVISTLKDFHIRDASLIKLFLNQRYLLICFLFGLLPPIYSAFFSPFPRSYHLVLPMHNRVIIDILNNSPYGSYPVPYWYTIAPYLLFAISSFMFNIESFNLFWSAPFLFYPVFSIGLYLFTFELTKKKLPSLFSGFMGVWIMTYEGVFQENYSITPRSFTYVFFPFALFLVQKYVMSKTLNVNEYFKLSTKLLITLLAFLVPMAFFSIGLIPFLPLKSWQFFSILSSVISNIAISRIFGKDDKFRLCALLMLSFLIFHTLEGGIYFFVILFYIFLIVVIREKPRYTILVPGLLALLLFSLLCTAFFSFTLDITSLVLGKNYGVVSFSERIIWLIEANTPVVLIIFLISSVALGLQKSRIYHSTHNPRSRVSLNLKNLTILIVSFTVILVYLLPISDSTRIGAALTPFMTYAIATFLLEDVPRRLKSRMNIRKFKIKRINTIYVIFCFVVLTPELVKPITYNRNPFFIAEDEYATVNYLYNIMPVELQKNTTILSDLRTMTVISGLTSIKSPVPRLMTEGEYPATAQEIINIIKNNIFLAPNAKSAYEAINRLRDMKFSHIQKQEGLVEIGEESDIILVLNGRTLRWLRDEHYFLFNSYEEASKYSEFYSPSFHRYDFGGRFVSSGSRGYLKQISIYAKNDAHENRCVTLYVSPFIDDASICSANINIPADQEGWFTSSNLPLFWNYDTMFIYHTSLPEDISVAFDTSPPFDYCEKKPDSFAWIQYPPRHYWVRVLVSDNLEDNKTFAINTFPRYSEIFLDHLYFELLSVINEEIYIFKVKKSINEQ